jgi:hypothetical protein
MSKVAHVSAHPPSNSTCAPCSMWTACCLSVSWLNTAHTARRLTGRGFTWRQRQQQWSVFARTPRAPGSQDRVTRRAAPTF